MDRNIISEDDVAEYRLEKDSESGEGPPTADDYWSRLLKYIPVEIIGAYLVIAGVLSSGYASEPANLRISLLILGLLSLGATWPYAARVHMVKRPLQCAVSSTAFLVWLFAIGGWFATNSWYAPWMGTIAIVVFGVVVKIARLGPLPREQSTPN